VKITGAFGSSASADALRTHDYGGVGMTAEFEQVSLVHTVFPTVVNEQRYDLAELAIVTFLQALDAGRPLCLLPVTLLGRFQHHCIVTMEGSGVDRAADLAGRRVGVRSWSQTTGVWVRGFLASDHGLDLSQVQWVVYEPAHVAGAADPAYVTRAPQGAKLTADFLDGTVDAAILGNQLPDDLRIRTVVPNPAREAAAWYGRTGTIPINHMVAASDDFVAENGALITGICGALAGTVPSTPRISSTPDFYPSGFDAVAPALDLVSRYAFDQGVISKALTADQIRAKTERLAGVDLGRLDDRPRA
jgi:4,5-dihydroxyphthalate decarboxylase